MVKLKEKIEIIIFAFVFVLGWLGISTASIADDHALKLAWSVKATSTPFDLSPVVAGDRVVVSDGDRTMAFDISKGNPLWKYEPKEGVWNRGLASDGKRVFVCLKGGGLSALNGTDGTLLWKIDLGIDCQRPPQISGEIIYVPTTFVGPGLKGDPLTGAKLFSINSSNGQVNWAFVSDNYILQTPYRKAGTVYVGGSYIDPNKNVDEGGPARFYALDSETGKPKWSYESEDGFVKALYATKKQLIFVGYQDFLTALDTSSGKIIWKRDTGNWVHSLNGMDNVVYYGSANTIVHAWHTSSGNSLWEFNIPDGSFNYMLGKPVFADGRVYFINQKGKVFALDRETGKMIWSHPTGMLSRVGLSLSGRYLFMGDASGRVYAYDILK